MARVLVAGGSGFIGTHMIRYLKSKGHYVVSTDIERPSEGSIRVIKGHHEPITRVLDLAAVPFEESLPDDQVVFCE